MTVISRIEADIGNGGWRMAGQVFNDADSLIFYQAVETWFDLYAGGWETLPRPAFNGHLLPEPWQKTVQTSSAPFNAFTAQEILKHGEIQGIFFTDQAVPANQHQINGATLAYIVEHIAGKTGEYGHCNLVKGVWPEGIDLDIDFDNSSEIDSYLIKQGNFWQTLQGIAEIDFYYLWFDKTNTLNFKPHPMFGASLPDPVFDLDAGWLAEPLDIETRNTEQVGQFRLNGTTPAGLQIFGKYPNDPTPGPVIEKSGYIATSDALMATIAERKYKFENRSHTVTARIGNGVGLLIDLMDRLSITYSSAADGINWTARAFWVHKIVVELLANFTARTTLLLEAENA